MTTSILIAARNEEERIFSCLNSLLNQNYPKDQYEIWVGDDGSTDRTKSIVESLKQVHQNLFILDIKQNQNNLKAKANVLAQLAHRARGAYFLITDADIVANPNWVKTLTKALANGYQLTTGATGVLGDHWAAKIQDAEWLFFIGMGHKLAQNNKPVSAIGNNMGISRQAYFELGGYENIPFSITEDLALFQSAMQKGMHFKTLFSSDALVETHAIQDIRTYINQRKRWMTGAFKLPFIHKMSFLLFSIYLPVLISASWYFGNFKIFLCIFFFNWFFHFIRIKNMYKDLNRSNWIGIVCCFPYQVISLFLMLLIYFIPLKINWKNRMY